VFLLSGLLLFAASAPTKKTPTKKAPPAKTSPTNAASANVLPADVPPLGEVVPPKSEFADDTKFGKDPFFPKSVRRNAAPARNSTGQSPETVDGMFLLQGVSLADGKKLALINNRTFAEGEEYDLRAKGRTNRVQCVEIHERHVIISIRGVTRKLDLRPGI
jgi:hypothetical protein